jgi:hypothetical protein
MALPSTSSRRLVFLATSTPFDETSTRHTVPEARSAARGDRGAANDPRQHLPEGQCHGRPDTGLFRHRMAVSRTSRARPACLAASGLAIDWAAGMLQAGILVGAWAPVRFLTHRCIDQAGRTHVWRRIITERCRGGSVSDAGDWYCCKRRRVAGGAAGSWDGTGSHALGVRHRRPPPSRLAGGADSREEWAVSTGNGDH